MYPKWFYHLIIAILEQATPSNSSNNKVASQSIISLLNDETESLLGAIRDEVRSSQQKEVVLKVTRSIYEFNRQHSQQHESPIWIKKQEKEILSPSNLMKLYDLYDRFCEGDRDEKGSEEVRKRKEQRPTMESAAEILARSFRKFAHLKAKKEE